jgi:hypothetical protein
VILGIAGLLAAVILGETPPPGAWLLVAVLVGTIATVTILDNRLSTTYVDVDRLVTRLATLLEAAADEEREDLAPADE